MVKTRLQVSGDGTNGARNYKSLGIAGTVSVIAGEEGVTAFWKVRANSRAHGHLSSERLCHPHPLFLSHSPT